MSCSCENRKRLEDIEYIRSLAKKMAKMEGCIYVLYEKNGIFNFVPDGKEYDGIFIEYVWYL